MPHAVLTIAGLDSSGGAGITADAAAVTTLGHDIAVACTAVTAQTGHGLVASHTVPPEMVRMQIDAAFAARDVRAVKTGMLVDRATVETVAEALTTQRERGCSAALVVDPVMAASAGGTLLADDAVDALRDTLLPLADVVTPNLAEAARLAGMPRVETPTDARRAAERILTRGPHAVIITGGHLSGDDAVDLLYDGAAFHEIPGRRERTSAHGSGCIYSASLAVYLAQGMSLERAAAGAKHMAILRLRGEI